MELSLTAFVAHRVRRLQTPRKLIEEIDTQPDPSPRCPPGKIKINVRLSNQVKPSSVPRQTQTKLKNLTGILPTPKVGTSPLIKTANNQSTPGQGKNDYKIYRHFIFWIFPIFAINFLCFYKFIGVTLKVAGGQQLQGYSVQLVQHQGSVKGEGFLSCVFTRLLRIFISKTWNPCASSISGCTQTYHCVIILAMVLEQLISGQLVYSFPML